jgi:adenylate cyclase
MDVRAHDEGYLIVWRGFVYPTLTALTVGYLWPLVRFFRDGCPQPASALVRRRAISFPTITGAIGFLGWAASPLFFGSLTLAHFGRWSTELMSQQVLSPLVNGFFAATTAYLYVDWIARCAVIPAVFPDGNTSSVPGTYTLGVRGRLFVYLAAVAFLPMFTMLGLIRAARVRLDAGFDMTRVIHMLDAGSTGVFAMYMVLGLFLTVLLARSFTGPLGNIAAALRRIQAGDLSAGVPVDSGDELGLLEEGVNGMVGSLRERERIMAAFGRVVEPAVRDRLLAGDLMSRGERRAATVMFCDIRGFTGFAERAPPEEVVATLNEFFTVATAWVRECGGFVDKFIGDAMLVVFGLFDDDPDGDAGARTAIRCSMGLRDRLADLNRTRTAVGKPILRVAMAVHTGELLAGTIGASDRHEYTVIGDTVNTTSRLLDVCKQMDADLLVSDAAFDLAANGDGAHLKVASRDSVVLRGRAEPVVCLTLA